MTVMPLLVPAPAVGATSSGSASPDGGTGQAGADFAALVTQALATGDPGAPAPPPAGPTPSAEDPASLAHPPTTLPTAPSLHATTGSSSLPPVTGLPPVTPDDEPEPATTDTPASGSAGSMPVIGLLVPPVVAVVAVDAPASTPSPATSPLTSDVRGADTPTPLPGVGPASSAESSAPREVEPVRPTSDTSASSAPAPVTTPAAPAMPAASAPPEAAVAAVTAPAATVATPTAASTAPASPVTAQVFPEVTRLVSTGTGTHRVTLQLNPAALGEVRVTLTVRAGVVRVSLAASSEAQASLLQGAPELRRLLELTGASDTRIVVRDLPVGAAPPMTASPSASTDTGTGAFGQAGSGQVGHGGDGSQDQHAGTRGGASNARDGDHDEAVRLRPIDPTTRTRTSGVDVTM